MTYTQKRKIVVDNEEYEWCIRGNYVWKEGARITIYKSGVSGTPIYLDPLPWEIEIRPKTIANAIKFALSNGWFPADKGKALKLGYLNNNFIVLPDEMNHTYEYEKSHKK